MCPASESYHHTTIWKRGCIFPLPTCSGPNDGIIQNSDLFLWILFIYIFKVTKVVFRLQNLFQHVFTFTQVWVLGSLILAWNYHEPLSDRVVLRTRGLTSRHGLGSGTSLIESGRTLSYAGVAVGVGSLIIHKCTWHQEQENYHLFSHTLKTERKSVWLSSAANCPSESGKLDEWTEESLRIHGL